MPVRIERKENVVSHQAIKRLSQAVNLNPTGVLLTQAANPYDVTVPAEYRGIYTPCWARIDNINNKKSRYGAQLVDPKDFKAWGMRADQCDKVNGYIKHATDKDVVLMYYPNPDLLIRRNAIAPMAAIQQYLSQADIAAFESQNKDSRRLDKQTKHKERSYPAAFEPVRMTEAEWAAKQDAEAAARPSVGIGTDGSLVLNDPAGLLSDTPVIGGVASLLTDDFATAV